MALSDSFTPVRYYTVSDPYYYTVDNRPLQDLAANTVTVSAAVDVLTTQNAVSSVGDANVTLTPKTSNGKAYYNTALTANRTVTLSTTNAVNGTTFKVVRTAASTGAFNIDVGGLKSLTAASQWAEVTYNGTAYVLTGYGTL